MLVFPEKAWTIKFKFTFHNSFLYLLLLILWYKITLLLFKRRPIVFESQIVINQE